MSAVARKEKELRLYQEKYIFRRCSKCGVIKEMLGRGMLNGRNSSGRIIARRGYCHEQFYNLRGDRR